MGRLVRRHSTAPRREPVTGPTSLLRIPPNRALEQDALGDSVGQRAATASGRQILVVKGLWDFDSAAEVGRPGVGQNGHAIFGPLAVPGRPLASFALVGIGQNFVQLCQTVIDLRQEGVGAELDRLESLEPLPGGFAGLLELAEEGFHGGAGTVQGGVGLLLRVGRELTDESGEPNFLIVRQSWMGRRRLVGTIRACFVGGDGKAVVGAGGLLGREFHRGGWASAQPFCGWSWTSWLGFVPKVAERKEHRFGDSASLFWSGLVARGPLVVKG